MHNYMLLPLALLLATALPAFAQEDGQEFWAPMRDGVLLKTTLYFPEGQGPWPLVLERTQFDTEEQQFRTFPDYHKTGVIWAIQNTRGRNGSGGEPGPIYDTDGWGALQDGYDTCAWIVQQPWSNGRIGTIGGSARGGYAHLLSAVNPPGLEAVFVRDGLANLWESILFTDGAWRYADSQWYALHGDINRLYAHPAFDDTWAPFDTTARSNVRDHAITYEVGWFDAFRQGSMHSWRDLQLYGTARARAESKLALEARGHIAIDQWLATQPWPASATVPPLAYQGRAMFDHYLKGEENGYPDLPKVTYYLMGNIDTIGQGGPGNEWHALDEWPPPVRWVPLYLQGDGKLTPMPSYPEPARLSYDYDPRNPMPTIGGSALFQGQPGMYDQREIESRGDVLTFETEPLPAPLEVTGPIRATLFASSDRVDTDFVVKVTDVYPDGRSMVVTDGILRASSRDSLRAPTPLEPGTVYRFDVRVWDTAMLFDAGHRIRITVTSSNYPRYAANPNTGAGPSAAQGETLIARNTIHLSPEYPSHIEIPVRERSDASVLWEAVEGTLPAVRLSNTQTSCDEAATIWATIDDAVDWERFDAVLHFNPNEARIGVIKIGSSFREWTLETTEIFPGQIAISMSAGEGARILSPQNLLEIRFDALKCDVDTCFYLSSARANSANVVSYGGKAEVFDPARIVPRTTLLGAGSMSVRCGEIFVDPGATATDPQDGDVTAQVQVTGSVDTATPGEYRIVYSTTDTDGRTGNAVFRFVTVVDEVAPVITLLGAREVTVECGETYVDAGATALDACQGEVILNAEVPAISAPGVYTVNYFAGDNAGNLARATRTVRVLDTTPPVLTGPGLADVTISCGTPLAAENVEATDDCEGVVEATITGEVAVGRQGVYTQTISVADAAGNRTARTRTVTVTDMDPPVITLNGAEIIELECGDAYFEPGAQAIDECTGPVPVVVEGTLPRPTPVGDYVRTYRAFDAAGNSATATRTVRVRDTTGPSVRIQGQTSVRVACGENYVDPGATALDDCSGTAAVTVGGDFDSRVPGEYALVYSATDTRGNTASASRVITVFDTAPPVLRLNGATRIEVACGATFDDPGATADDRCSGNVPVTRDPVNPITDEPGSYSLVYEATDAAGNTARTTRTLVVLPCEVAEGEPEGEGEGEGEGRTLEEWAEHLLARFETLDINADAMLRFEEITADVPAIDRTVFEQLDLDANGVVSRSELEVLAGEDVTPPACGCLNTMEKGVRDLTGDLFLGLLAIGILLASGPLWRQRT